MIAGLSDLVSVEDLVETSSRMIDLPFGIEPLDGPNYQGKYWPLTTEEVATPSADFEQMIDAQGNINFEYFFGFTYGN